MSAIWLIAKDVLTATWSMPAKRLMGIFLRLSVVVGVIMTGAMLVERYVAYHSFASSQFKESLRIYSGLQCAQAFSDEVLLSRVNQHGTFDISKVGCFNKVFWARLSEIRSLPKEPPRSSDVRLSDYLNLHNAYSAAIIGAICAALVVVLGLLIILLRHVAIWVIGS